MPADSLKGLTHEGGCSPDCPPGTAVYLDPLTRTAFRCARCHALHYRAVVRDRVQPLHIHLPGVTLPAEYLLTECAAWCHGVADLVGLGGEVAFECPGAGIIIPNIRSLRVLKWGKGSLYSPPA